ncbi:MAG TPA: hypothetical protein VLH79_02225 [Chthonomonadales bacterium]|nr:hypothetical protein [Chthonomonadales bacterium]
MKQAGVAQNGIAQLAEDGEVVLWRPSRASGAWTRVAVGRELADRWRVATGDVVAGPKEAVADAAPGEPEERLIRIDAVNGLGEAEALERPSPRRRGPMDRSTPERLVALAAGPADATGRLLDLAAPLALGSAGLVHGPHGSGLTRTLQAVAAGVAANAPDVRVVPLLVRARGEEVTDWRRRFPCAEVIGAPVPEGGAAAAERVLACELVLAFAQRRTEVGEHVLLVVDSLTAVWSAMLEAEEADAQREADRAGARARIREWLAAAGWFGGEGFLGAGLGGSLTLVGSAWSVAVDPDAEEEGETHPDLRLLEHTMDSATWSVALSGELARARLFPAIDPCGGRSRWEDALTEPARLDRRLAARRLLAGLPEADRHVAVMAALGASDDGAALLAAIEAGDEPGD